MARARQVPISGARPEISLGRPIVPNAKDTSLDAQRMISAPPHPFTDNMTSAQIPAPSNRNFSKDQTAGLPAKSPYGTSRGGYVISDVSIHQGNKTTQDMLDAVGEPRLPEGYNSIMNGRPIPGPARRTGPDSQPKSRGRK